MKEAGGQLIPTSASVDFSRTYSPLLETTLKYTNDFGEHSFELLAGNTYTNLSRRDALGGRGEGFPNENLQSLNAAAVTSLTSIEVGIGSGISYFGRLDYKFKNRYLFQATIRRDGSDKFSPENKWGNFPSVSAGWKIHEEAFLRDSETISQLKLRGSWGIAGNDAIPQFQFSAFVFSNPFYILGGELVNGATLFSGISPDIKWESTESIGVGLDLGLLKNKVTLTLDYYKKNTDDILFGVPQPLSLGLGGGCWWW